MATDIEGTLRELFGESFAKVTQFQKGQLDKAMSKVRELAREAVHDDLARLTHEVSELRERVAVLESERAAKAADGIGSSF